jgi:hypothetical protein
VQGPTGKNTRLTISGVATVLITLIAALTQLGFGLSTPVMVVSIISIVVLASVMIIADTIRSVRTPVEAPKKTEDP